MENSDSLLFQNVTLLEFHIKNVEISFISSNIKEEYTIIKHENASEGI